MSIEEYLVLDIGESYIKSVLVRKNWDNSVEYVYSTSEKTKGIEKKNITNLRSLSECILKVVYRTEVDTGSSIKKVIVLNDCFDYKIKIVTHSFNVNGIVKQKHIDIIDEKFNIPLFNVGFLSYKYEIDNLKNIENPIGMCGGHLKFFSSFLTMENSYFRNLVMSLKRNEIDLCFFGNGNLLTSTAIKDKNFAIIDLGYSKTRILVQEEFQITLLEEEVGFRDLENILWKQGKEHIDIVDDDNNDNFLTREFFIGIFKKISDDLNKFHCFSSENPTIYLTGGITLIPLIERLLNITIDRNFEILNLNKPIKTKANKALFTPIFAAIDYIFSDKTLYKIRKV